MPNITSLTLGFIYFHQLLSSHSENLAMRRLFEELIQQLFPNVSTLVLMVLIRGDSDNIKCAKCSKKCQQKQYFQQYIENNNYIPSASITLSYSLHYRICLFNNQILSLKRLKAIRLDFGNTTGSLVFTRESIQAIEPIALAFRKRLLIDV